MRLSTLVVTLALLVPAIGSAYDGAGRFTLHPDEEEDAATHMRSRGRVAGGLILGVVSAAQIGLGVVFMAVPAEGAGPVRAIGAIVAVPGLLGLVGGILLIATGAQREPVQMGGVSARLSLSLDGVGVVGFF